MQQTIPVNDRVIATQVGITPSTGPFTVDFPFFSLADVVVTWLPDGGDVATTLVRGADYDLAGVATEDGSFSSGTITLVLPVANGILSRYGNTTIERLSNFPLQGFFSRLALNAELNRITVVLQEHDGTIRIARTDLESSLHIPLSEADDGLVTVAAPKLERAGKILAWDDLGNLIHSVNTLSDIESVNVGVFDELYVNVTGDNMSGPLSVPFLTSTNVTINTSMQVLPGGTAKAPTPGANDVSTNLATTAWVVGFLGAQGQGEAIYKFGGSVAGGDPGTGNIVIDPGTGIERVITMSRLDADGVARFLTAMGAGDAMVVTNELTPVTAYARYTLTSDVTDNGTWVQFSAHLNDSSNPLEAPPLNTRLRVTGFLNTMSGGAAISGVAAGYGLTGGGSSGVIPMAIDTAIVAEVADLAGYVLKAGDTMTGPLSGTSATMSANIITTGGDMRVDRATGQGSMEIRTAAGQTAVLYFRTGALNRWALFKNTTAEGGANAGSNLQLNAYDDAGTTIGTAWNVTRSTLATALGGALTGTTATFTGAVKAGNVAIPAGGTLGLGAMFSTTANFGIHFGSGVPDKAAARGSLYLRSDGAPQYNTNGTAGGWSELGGGGGAATWVGTSPPPVPIDGQLWFYSDASIGGGQLYIYYNDLFGSPASQWVPASPGVGSGAVVQTQTFQTGAVATGSTIIPVDDTIPQIGEGNEYMTCAITPRSATSKLVIDVTWHGSSSANVVISAALFQDANANALAAAYAQPFAAAAFTTVKFTHTMTSGTTSATTFRVRAGGHAAGTTTFNGNAGARHFGGVMASSIVIQEVL